MCIVRPVRLAAIALMSLLLRLTSSQMLVVLMIMEMKSHFVQSVNNR